MAHIFWEIKTISAGYVYYWAFGDVKPFEPCEYEEFNVIEGEKMAYLEEILPEFRAGAKIRRKDWPENLSISLKGCCGLNVAFYDVDADDWEIYQEPIDWKYIIDNGCLCWFWDNESVGNFMAELEDFRSGAIAPFKSKKGATWRNCRPVKKDEVNFYKDTKDE